MAVSVLFDNKKQCVSCGFGNWIHEGKRRFVWSLAPYEGDRFALTVVADLPENGLQDGAPAVLVINDVPYTVFWAQSDSVQMRVAHVCAETERLRFAGFVSDDRVVRWAELH